MTDREALAEAVLWACQEEARRPIDDGFEWYGSAIELADRLIAAGVTLRSEPTLDEGLLARALEIVSRHTHRGLWAMTRYAGDAPEDDCLLCRALVKAGVLTIDQIGAGTRAAIAAQERETTNG